MSAKRAARHNTLVVEFLQSRLDSAHRADFSECRLFDSDGSKYLLQREQDTPDVIRLSFALAGSSSNAAVSANLASITADLQVRHQGHCHVSSGEGTYQVKIDLLCDSLIEITPAQQLSCLQRIACVRADTLCWPLR